MHPTAAQVQQAAADEQAAIVSRWRTEVPIAGQLRAVSCELRDHPPSQVVLPGERPTVWPVYQQTGRIQRASGAPLCYGWASCHALSTVWWWGVADPKTNSLVFTSQPCWSRLLLMQTQAKAKYFYLLLPPPDCFYSHPLLPETQY